MKLNSTDLTRVKKVERDEIGFECFGSGSFFPFTHLLSAEQSSVGAYICQINGSNLWLKKHFGLKYLLVDFESSRVAFGNDKQWLAKEPAAIKTIAVGYKMNWEQPLKRLDETKVVIRHFSARFSKKRKSFDYFGTVKVLVLVGTRKSKCTASRFNLK